MDQKRNLFLVQIARAAIVAFLLGFFIAWLFFNYPPKDSGQIAAWVQAAGSIGAVAAAIYIMSRQTKTQRDLKLLEKKEALDSAVGLIVRAGEHIQAYIDEPDLAAVEMRGRVSPINVWVEVFSSLDITAPALQEIAIYIVNIRLHITTMQSVFIAIDNQEAAFDEQLESLKIGGNSIKKNADRCLEVQARYK